MTVEKFGAKYCDAHNETCASIAVLKSEIEELKNFKNVVTMKLDEINRINDKITRIEVLMEREFKSIQEKFVIAQTSKTTFVSNFVYPLIVALLGGGIGFIISLAIAK